MAGQAPLPQAEHWARLRRWLQPGIAVKRWVAVYVVALTLVALGLGLVLTHLYRTAPFPEPIYYLTLQFIPRFERGLVLVVAGGALMAWATWRILATFVGVLVPSYRTRYPGRLGLSDALYAQRILSRGPRVVAIGGGTGLSTVLRGLKAHTSNLTAVVTVGDDGGSSGRLRRDLRVLPPGDFRQCIAALADSDPLVPRLFEHRFQGDAGELSGHAFGNLYIAAMAQITGGFERALEESSRVLNVRGRILPSTLADVVLCAELADRSTVAGESRIPERVSGGQGAGHGPGEAAPGRAAPAAPLGIASSGPPGSPARPARPAPAPGELLDTQALRALLLHDGAAGPGGAPGAGAAAEPGRPNPIRRVFLQPERPAVYPEVVRALLDADLIVLGPGSLYTSLLPNLLVGDLARALCWSRAVKLYVCNVATQPGETDHYDVNDHVQAIFQHLEETIGLAPDGTGSWARGAPFTHVLVNNNLSPEIPDAWGVTRPAVRAETLTRWGVEALAGDVVDVSRPTRHDPAKLARALLAAYARLRPAPRSSPRDALRGWWGLFSPARPAGPLGGGAPAAGPALPTAALAGVAERPGRRP